jgi:hypothetical protein
MKKLSLIVISASMCLAGCTTGYRVHVNGFSEQGRHIANKASIYVSLDPNSRNPIFDEQIKAKIEELLKWYDYVPAPSLEQSDYRLTFHAWISSHHSYGFYPFYQPYMGFSGGYWNDYYFGYSTYVPYYDTFYNQRLMMKVFTHNPGDDSDAGKIVWVGDAVISASGDDFRKTIDYLLVACFEYFGIDTTEQKSLVITEKDPRILKIESIR